MFQRSCVLIIALWNGNDHMLGQRNSSVIVIRSVPFTVPNSTDGSLSEESWFNNKQLCTEDSTASGIATPAETLKANLGEIL